tara:strand:- start:150 stop:344 length:195 start_codon:yes stop_codon:yes gene_type:complete
MAVYRQKIIFYKEIDGELIKKIKIPKTINTDILFELQFGFSPPKKNAKLSCSTKEYPTPNSIQE